MKKLLKLLLIAAVLGAIGYGGVLATRGRDDAGPDWKLIPVERATSGWTRTGCCPTLPSGSTSQRERRRIPPSASRD